MPTALTPISGENIVIPMPAQHPRPAPPGREDWTRPAEQATVGDQVHPRLDEARTTKRTERTTVSVFADENELLERARHGDDAAFTSLLRMNDRPMRACAWQLLGNQAAMDDALQDAYVKAYQSIETFRGDAKFSSWLYRIVYRTCLDHQRYRRRRPSTPLEVDGQILPEATQRSAGRDHAETVARRDELRDAIARLPEDQAAVVILVDAEGLSYDEVGRALDLPKGTIASRLSRARATLRSLLAPSAPPSSNPPPSTTGSLDEEGLR